MHLSLLDFLLTSVLLFGELLAYFALGFDCFVACLYTSPLDFMRSSFLTELLKIIQWCPHREVTASFMRIL